MIGENLSVGGGQESSAKSIKVYFRAAPSMAHERPKLFSNLPKACLVRLSISVVGRLHRRSTHTGGRVARVGVVMI
jgi:hypothetical protein